MPKRSMFLHCLLLGVYVGYWPCGSMVDWTKTTSAGGFPVSKHHEGALNAKYWVELLLLQHVSRPFSFHPTTNISVNKSPQIVLLSFYM